MSNNIQLHKNDLPDDLYLGNLIAVDGEFMGLNVRRDPLCLIQISSGNSDAHIVQFDRKKYNAPNLVKLLQSADKVILLTGTPMVNGPVDMSPLVNTMGSNSNLSEEEIAVLISGEI